MKALTLFQPWATLIAIGAKKIETRSWSTKYRGPLAIHAGIEKKYVSLRSKDYICAKEPFYSVLMEYYRSKDLEQQLYRPMLHLRGAIIAICELVACVRTDKRPWALSDQEKAFGDYTPGRFMWILDKVQKLEKPIPVKGAMGLWNIQDFQIKR